MRNTGVYKIQIGKYFYVGQSKDLKTREYSHLNSLKKGILTQGLWIKYVNVLLKSLNLYK